MTQGTPLQCAGTPTVHAGPFGRWLAQFRASLQGNAGMDVPCGDCTGCCTSGYSIQLRPGETAALARIPAEALARPPGFPRDHATLPALPDGTCPMLRGGRCTIYAQRPQTCLDYDCRIFAAAAIDAGGADKAVINERVRAWRFSYPTDEDLRAHAAVRAAAAFIVQRSASFTGLRVPTAPTGIAVLAIKAYGVFIDPAAGTRDATEVARAIVAASRAFDRAGAVG
jgi:hypothetical protein